MKTLIAMFLVVCSFAASAVGVNETLATEQGLNLLHGRCAPQNVLFFAATKDRQHDILACQTQTTVFITFGEPTAKSADRMVWIEVPTKKVQLNYGTTDKGIYYETVAVPEFSKQMWHTVGLTFNKDKQLTVVMYRITNETMRPIEVVFDPDTMISGVRSHFVPAK